MAETHYPVAKLAARRPDWELPELHSDLQLAPLDVLHTHKERIKCPKCGRSRAHYCYDCLQPLVPFPQVDLPFRVSIVTHEHESASKNTGVQLAILAAGKVDMHSIAQVPTDVDPSRCVVLFPSDTALEVEQLEPDSIDRLFIIDSRWKKAGELVRTDTFRAMRAVKLSRTRSAFWRFHTRGVAEEGVCTIEALFFFLDALAKQGKLSDPRFTAPHAFDNLLWYFVYQHTVVQQACHKRLQERGPQGQGQAADSPSGEGEGQQAATTARPQQQKQQQQKGQKQQQKPRKEQRQRQAASEEQPPQQQQTHHADAAALGEAAAGARPPLACGEQLVTQGGGRCGAAEDAGRLMLAAEAEAGTADGGPGADGAAAGPADDRPGGGGGLLAGEGPCSGGGCGGNATGAGALDGVGGVHSGGGGAAAAVGAVAEPAGAAAAEEEGDGGDADHPAKRART
ncbi:hypothetical protein PLESTB_000217400 [Pleodorina starrii]|uniref:tRNA-uridine aminocarboxypropyltransferase 1 n=1 Tax=Pleodorina starrii TaxID=330485 RepID=A0A9W6BC38_9CHLO|nr:hypothetical protein PLESTM_001543100 [Pleodorina starrii]GLC49421.1 hypothetical protein PLESTB_000217400 [Pleodorina starrii]GLC75653.1 hypothetical protein PLESTF_001670400 [Pleodorina starrii]